MKLWWFLVLKTEVLDLYMTLFVTQKISKIWKYGLKVYLKISNNQIFNYYILEEKRGGA